MTRRQGRLYSQRRDLAIQQRQQELNDADARQLRERRNGQTRVGDWWRRGGATGQDSMSSRSSCDVPLTRTEVLVPNDGGSRSPNTTSSLRPERSRMTFEVRKSCNGPRCCRDEDQQTCGTEGPLTGKQAAADSLRSHSRDPKDQEERSTRDGASGTCGQGGETSCRAASEESSLPDLRRHEQVAQVQLDGQKGQCVSGHLVAQSDEVGTAEKYRSATSVACSHVCWSEQYGEYI